MERDAGVFAQLTLLALVALLYFRPCNPIARA
jgi:hypothetical protein